MSERWEYMAVSWTYTADTKDETPAWRQHINIHRAGQKTKSQQYWSSETPHDTGSSLLEIFNELGAEGWELVSDTVSDSTIVLDSGGWPEVGTPTDRQYILKRRL